MSGSERPLRIFFAVGEPSGDSHAAAVARELRRLEPDIELRALGGPRLEAAGVPITRDFTEHAAMGLFPVLAKLPTFLSIMKETRDDLVADPPDLVVPVDYPGFNLRLSRQARAAGIPVCFYVSPQVWAWRPGRIHKIGRSVDHMMVLFDFEVPLYQAIDVPVTFVGHPLFDSLAGERPKSNLRRDLGLAPTQPIVGILPGSRTQEVRTILPELLDAARIIAEKRPDAAFPIAIARPSLRPIAEAIIARRGQGLPLHILDGRAHDLMAASRVALTASGTATLELAYFETPMVIAYKITRFAKAVVPMLGIGLIGLVNIVAGKELCKEFLDSADRSADIAAEALELLRDGARRKRVLSGLRHVKQRVAVRGTAERAARCILDVAREHRARRSPSR